MQRLLSVTSRCLPLHAATRLSYPSAVTMATATRTLRSAAAAAPTPTSEPAPSSRTTSRVNSGAAAAAAATQPIVAAPTPTSAAAAVARPRGRPRGVAKTESAASVGTTALAAGAAAASSSAASSSSSAAPSATPYAFVHSAQGAALLQSLRRSLIAVADPSRAEGMQRYMKSVQPCHGCSRGVSLTAFKEAFRDVRFGSAEEWAAAVATIWAGATHREERYGAIWLLRNPPTAAFGVHLPVALPLLRHLVEQGAWWDYVDEICTYPLGDLLRADPVVMVPELERWAAGDVLWLRRAAILAQLSCKGAAIDMPLLFRLIRPAMSDQTFWLRKAIGWGLRQAARDHAAEVLHFVRDNHASLSTLSRREALKHLGGDKGLAHVTAAAAAAAAAATSHDAPAGSASTTKGRKRKAAAAASE